MAVAVRGRAGKGSEVTKKKEEFFPPWTQSPCPHSGFVMEFTGCITELLYNPGK